MLSFSLKTDLKFLVSSGSKNEVVVEGRRQSIQVSAQKCCADPWQAIEPELPVEVTAVFFLSIIPHLRLPYMHHISTLPFSNCG